MLDHALIQEHTRFFFGLQPMVPLVIELLVLVADLPQGDLVEALCPLEVKDALQGSIHFVA